MTKVKIKIKIRMKMKIEINTNVNIQKICDDDGTHYGSGFVCSMAKVYVIPPPPFEQDELVYGGGAVGRREGL